MVYDNVKELLSELKQIHPDLKLISTELIVVGNWVSLKCRYGCRNYGRHFCCPPFVPTPEEMRLILKEYQCSVLVKIEIPAVRGSTKDQARAVVLDSKKNLQKIVYEMERCAFLSGYYKAFAMASSPCHLCQTCIAEERLEKGETLSPNDALSCRNKKIMRPSMEACGIDVFWTVRNAGFNPRVLKNYSESVEIIGLVLLD